MFNWLFGNYRAKKKIAKLKDVVWDAKLVASAAKSDAAHYQKEYERAREFNDQLIMVNRILREEKDV